MSIICTSSGVAFDVLNPTPDMVRLGDIAHALSHIPRFGGHALEPYSVAAHSVAVSYLVPAEYAAAGLLHDAAEAYLGDIPTPIKQLLPDYQRLYAGVERAIAERFGIPDFDLWEIKDADAYALKTERAQFMPRTDWWPCDRGQRFLSCREPESVRVNFLRRAKELGIK